MSQALDIALDHGPGKVAVKFIDYYGDEMEESEP